MRPRSAFLSHSIAQTKSNQVQCGNLFSLKQISAPWLVQISSFALYVFNDHVTFWRRFCHYPGFLVNGSLQSLSWSIHMILCRDFSSVSFRLFVCFESCSWMYIDDFISWWSREWTRQVVVLEIWSGELVFLLQLPSGKRLQTYGKSP